MSLQVALDSRGYLQTDFLQQDEVLTVVLSDGQAEFQS
jgi:hypothetical protein